METGVLKLLLAPPKKWTTCGQVRRREMNCEDRGIRAEVVPAYPENTEQLNKQLEEHEGIPLPTDQAGQHTSARKPKDDPKLQDEERILLKINLKPQKRRNHYTIFNLKQGGRDLFFEGEKG